MAEEDWVIDSSIVGSAVFGSASSKGRATGHNVGIDGLYQLLSRVHTQDACARVSPYYTLSVWWTQMGDALSLDFQIGFGTIDGALLHRGPSNRSHSSEHKRQGGN